MNTSHNRCSRQRLGRAVSSSCGIGARTFGRSNRSEEHTSELQSQSNLVCRLLLEKKKNNRQDAPRDHALISPLRVAFRELWPFWRQPSCNACLLSLRAGVAGSLDYERVSLLVDT